MRNLTLARNRFHLLLSAVLFTSSAALASDVQTLIPTNHQAASETYQYEPTSAPYVTPDAVSQLEARIARLEAELANQQTSNQNVIGYTPMQFASPPPDSAGHLFGSVEVTLLRPRVSGAIGAFSYRNGGRLLSNEFDTGVRYVLGYRAASGLGLRGRYWSYDHDLMFQPPFSPARMSVDTQAADLEITFLQKRSTWELDLFTGLRYGKLRYHSDTLGAFGVGEAYFEGLGPTVGADARRHLGTSGFSVFGNIRGSVLFGEIRNQSLLLNIPAGPISSEVASTIEHQLGVAWSTPLGQSSAELELRTAWETQYWMSETLSDDAFGIGSNLGFMGPTFAVERRY